MPGGEDHHLPDAAIEALGGPPPDVERAPVSAVEAVVPAGLAGRIDAFDKAVDRLFDRRLRGRAVPDRVFYTASALGDFSLLWHLIATARALRSSADEQASLRLAVALGAESVIVNWGVKSLFRRARPEWDEHRPRSLRKPRTSSFPSGHASSGFLAASMLAERSRTPVAWYALATIVAASRVHVRIHHGSDVVGGVAFGLVAGRLVRRIWPVREG